MDPVIENRENPCPNRRADGVFFICSKTLRSVGPQGEPAAPMICPGSALCFFEVVDVTKDGDNIIRAQRLNRSGNPLKAAPVKTLPAPRKVPGADKHAFVGSTLWVASVMDDGVYALIGERNFVCVDFWNPHLTTPTTKPLAQASLRGMWHSKVNQAMESKGVLFVTCGDYVWVEIEQGKFNAEAICKAELSFEGDISDLFDPEVVEHEFFAAYLMDMIHQAKQDKCAACKAFNSSSYYECDEKGRSKLIDTYSDARIESCICCGYDAQRRVRALDPCFIWLMREKAHAISPEEEPDPCSSCASRNVCSQQLSLGYGVAEVSKDATCIHHQDIPQGEKPKICVR